MGTFTGVIIVVKSRFAVKISNRHIKCETLNSKITKVVSK